MAVYAIESAGLIKIGFTQGSVATRVTQLQRMNATDLRLVATWRGDRELEARMHRLFDEHRRQGEWFAMPSGWRELANVEAGMTSAGARADEQKDLALRLLDELESSGADDVSLSMILDSLAVAGVALVEDAEGAASTAWFALAAGD